MRTDLTLAEWAVLGLLCERPAHGWHLVGALRPGGEVGDVWSCTRPLVYRAIGVLDGRGLIQRHGTQKSHVGPARTLLAVTPAGRRALSTWLRTPVEHVRDVRSELMLKLLLHDRLRRDPARLIDRQKALFVSLADSLEAHLARAEGFDRTLALWRQTNAQGTLRFLDRLEGHRD